MCGTSPDSIDFLRSKVYKFNEGYLRLYRIKFEVSKFQDRCLSFFDILLISSLFHPSKGISRWSQTRGSNRTRPDHCLHIITSPVFQQ